MYRAIADALAEDILRGRLAPGTRLPTHRELAERVGVTVGTVTRAYAEAGRRGLVSGEVGRGTYVRMPEPPLTMPTPVGWGGEGAPIDLGVNAPATPEGDPASQALRRSLEALRQTPWLAQLTEYPPPAGLPEHRAAGAAWVARFGVKARPEQVVVCAGGQHALEVALGSLTRPGDVVLVEALAYPGLKLLGRRLHLRLHGVAVDGQGLVPEALEAACRSSGARLLCCTPTLQNPTGTVLSEERRQRIAETVRRHGLVVVEDDAYGLLPEPRPPPLAALVPESSCFIAGVSKLLTPALRMGYLVVPPSLREQFSDGMAIAALSASPLMAEVAARWVEDGTAEALVEQRRQEALERLALALSILGPWLTLRSHQPLYHVWLELPARWSSESFTAQARSRGVAVSPASLFTVSAGAAPAAVRVSIGAPRTRGQLEQGLRRLREVLEAGPESLPHLV